MSVINPIILITLLAAVLRFFHLDYYSLWGDEIFFVDLSKGATLFTTVEIFHLPLAPLFIKLFSHFFGTSDFVIRLPFAIFSTLSVVSLYLVGKKLFSKRVGIVTAFLLAISVYAIGEAQDAKVYSMMTFFTTISTYFLFILIKEKFKLRNLIFLIISLFLLVYSGYIGFLPASIFILFIAFLFFKKLFFGDRKERKNSLPIKKIILLALISVFFLILFINFSHFLLANKTLSIKSAPLKEIFSQDRIISVRGILVEFSNNFPLYFFFFAWAFIFPFVKRRENFVSWSFLYLWVIVLSGYFFLLTVQFNLIDEPGGFPINLPRYYIYFLPVYLLIIAVGIDIFSEPIARILKKIKPLSLQKFPLENYLTGVIILIFVFFSISPLKNYYFVPQGFRADWKSAGEYLTTYSLPGDAFIRGIREQRDTNYVGHYFDYEKRRVDYTIFPLKEKKTNWYVSGDFDFPYFEDWTVSFSIHPSHRSFPLRVFKLAYIGQGNEVIKINNRKKWKIEASSNENRLKALVDDDPKTWWETDASLKKGDYLQIDIGENKVLTRISIVSQAPYNIKDYLVQVSSDRISWQIVQSAFTGQDPYFYYTPQIPFEPVRTRFIKITSLSDDKLPWSISEIDLYEVKKRGVPNLYDKPTKFSGLVVSDPDASNGYAKFVPEYSPTKFRLFQYGERVTLPSGLYGAKFRIKTDNNKKEDNLGNVTNLMIDLGLEKVGVFLPRPLRIKATDFKQPNKYQEFYLNFSHDGKGHVVFRIRNYGQNNYWFDYPEIEKISQ